MMTNTVRNWLTDPMQEEKRNPRRVITFKKLSDRATYPLRSTKGSAGMDLYSAENKTIEAKSRALVETDILAIMPRGTYGRVAPRSGLSLNRSIDIGGGVIDEDYRGSIGIIVINNGDEEFNICQGQRIAQLICEVICYPDIEELDIDDEIEETTRGDKGFGSSG